MTDLTELKRLADAAPMAMTMTNGSEEHKALLAFTDEVKRLFGNDVGMARALLAENEALRENADKWQIIERAMEQLKADERGGSIWSVCARLLISTAHKLNSATSTVTEEGVTIGDQEIGDWRVTVERVNMSKEG